eukprot:GHVP01061476.1.p1 GENE.GHVP01061476.1~~GHVP01061476.1.p1  ORF type:complete len:225 (+),score=42.36 GHVP01061476.1:712-1386(+)
MEYNIPELRFGGNPLRQSQCYTKRKQDIVRINRPPEFRSSEIDETSECPIWLMDANNCYYFFWGNSAFKIKPEIDEKYKNSTFGGWIYPVHPTFLLSDIADPEESKECFEEWETWYKSAKNTDDAKKKFDIYKESFERYLTKRLTAEPESEARAKEADSTQESSTQPSSAQSFASEAQPNSSIVRPPPGFRNKRPPPGFSPPPGLGVQNDIDAFLSSHDFFSVT